ncbi:hypothetical protein ACLBXM_18900 [Xanthobacteraceae bacterium A53D]
MTRKKLTARERLEAAEEIATRWRQAIAKADAEMTKAADRGNAARVASILDRRDRLHDRLQASEHRVARQREALPRVLKGEKAAQAAVRSGVKLADRVAAAAPAVQEQWRQDRKEQRVQQIRRQRKGLRPEGHDGKLERATKIVRDPYDGTPLKVIINAYESPLQHMATRKKIDAAQLDAGERFRTVYERASIGAVKAIDYGRPQVDGGKLPDVLSDDVAAATRELAGLKGVVGSVCFAYLAAVVGERVSMKEMARHYGKLAGDRAEGFIAGQVICGLDRLVEHWRLIAKGLGTRRGGAHDGRRNYQEQHRNSQ